MAANGRRETVGAAAELLVPQGMKALVKNRDATNSVDLGGPGVTAGAGYELKTGEALEIDASVDAVYAIRSGAADVRVDVLELRSPTV